MNTKYILVIALFLASKAAFAEDARSEFLWFTSLVEKNSGKTFCPPPNTSLIKLMEVLAEHGKAHPELNGRVTEQQAIQGLAESYPCSAGMKKIDVSPTGEYATIDTTQNFAIMQKLRNPLLQKNDALIEEITKNSGNYMPNVFFLLAIRFYGLGELDKAIFWFHAARVRSSLDVVLCTDTSARSGIYRMVSQMPLDMIKKQFDDIPKLRGIFEQVIKWDEITPHNYDRRWMCLNGMAAIKSGLSPNGGSAETPIMLPADKWDDLVKRNRDFIRKSFEELITFEEKKKAKSVEVK